MPAVGVSERGDELAGGGGAEFGKRRLLEAVGDDAVESTAVAAASEIEVLLDDGRQAVGVLDDLAVHVEDVERAVGGVGELDGTEPDVAGGDEFGFFVDAAADEADAVGFETLAVDQVAADIADDRYALPLAGPGVAAIDSRARSAGEIAGSAAAAFDGTGDHAGDAEPRADDAPRLDGAGAKDVGLRTVGGDA